MTDAASDVIYADRLDVLKRLLDLGVDPQGKNSHQNTLVSVALDHHSRPAMRLLLERGVPAATVNELLVRRSGLHNDDRLQDAALYLEFHADPDSCDSDGKRLLANMVIRGDVEMAQLLLKHGAKPNLLNEKGRTALDLTSDTHPSKRAAMVALLKAHGALSSTDLDLN